MSLKDLLNKESKINHLKVKILSNHEDKFIVGDSSMMAIFNASNKDQQKLTEGKCYMLLKPIKLDEKVLFAMRMSRLSLYLIFLCRTRKMKSFK